MNLETTLLAVCIVFTLALVLQVGLLAATLAFYLRMRKQVAEVSAKAMPLIEKIEPIAEASQRLLEEVRRYADEIATKTNDLLDLSHKQLVRVDGVMAEATARTRSQMDRIEMVLDDTINRFQETTSLLQNGIVKPLRQLNAVTTGVRAALSFLAQGRRTTVEQATHDEEMFI